jgi:predicted nucleic-acid-binding Zn-ribbon protein
MTRTRYRCPICGGRDRFNVAAANTYIDANGKVVALALDADNIDEVTCESCGHTEVHDDFLAHKREWKDDD